VGAPYNVTLLDRPASQYSPGVSRLWVVICGLIAGAVAISSSKVIFSWVLYSWGALGASFGAVLSIAFLWKRCSPIAALLGLVVGPVIVVIWNAVGWSNFLYELVPAFVISIAVTVFGSMVFPAPVDDNATITKQNIEMR